MVSQDIPEETNFSVLIASLVVASIFVALRSWARWYKNRLLPYAAEDIAIYIALGSFATMCALYLDILPVLTNVMKIQAGLAMPYATMLTDVKTMLKEFFAVQIFFWLTLWAVKFSLLLMFQRLTTGLPHYEKVWWGVVIFTALTFIGCIVTQFTTCSSMHAWFNVGLCSTPRDAAAKAASLWYSLAVDLITDLMIIAVPVRVLWDLRISTAQKLSVGVVFIVGIITMIFAVVRVVSLDSGVSHGQVNSSWLILWAAIEGVVAIIVGCLPSFAIFIRGRVEASRSNPTYDPYATNETTGTHPNSRSQNTRSRTKAKARIESLSLDDLSHDDRSPQSGGGRIKSPQQESFKDSEMEMESRRSDVRTRGSESELVSNPFEGDDEQRHGEKRNGNGITVTQNWSQKWHLGGPKDEEREKVRKLGLSREV